MVEVMDYLPCPSPPLPQGPQMIIGERGEPNTEIPGAATVIIGDTPRRRVPCLEKKIADRQSLKAVGSVIRTFGSSHFPAVAVIQPDLCPGDSLALRIENLSGKCFSRERNRKLECGQQQNQNYKCVSELNESV